jgi:membrane protein DedA with SNARE-associated domain
MLSAVINKEGSMIHVGHFLTNHPLALLAVTILLEQAGIPITSAPLLLLIGALTGSESVSIPLALVVAISASVFIDCALFDLGRSRKSNPSRAFKHLQMVDARSFRIGHLFTRRAGLAMLVTRFLPGPNLVATLAGISGYSRLRFLLLDIIVSGSWAILYLAAGHFLPRELRSWLSSTMCASPAGAICLILGFAVAILGIPRFARLLSDRRASRPNVPGPVASELIASDNYVNPEVVQTAEVQ